MKEKEFEDKILSLKDAMYRLALSLLGNEAEAQDAVQDILERMWRDRDKLATYSNPRAFIFVALRNNCFDRLRRKQVRKNVGLEQAAGAPGIPGEDLDRQAMVRLAKKAMEGLPEKQRTVMHLRDVEGLELDEIAVIMKTDEGVVRSNLSRARKKVREEITKKQNMAHIDKKRLELLREKFYEGASTLAEEKELAEFTALETSAYPAEEAMFALFGQEKQTRYPGVAVPLQRRRKPALLFAASAAVAALLVALSITLRTPGRPAEFCVVDRIPVTDPAAAMEKKEMAIDMLLSALDNTASMMNPLEELERAMGELENLGLFNITDNLQEDV